MPMTAKYATTCATCGQPVQPGDEIAKAGKGWGHTACADTSVAGRTVAGRTSTRPRPADMPGVDGALEVWTDGACSGNPGPGGWAWATRDGRQGSGAENPTTNQRMEIRAAAEAVAGLVEAVRQRGYISFRWVKGHSGDEMNDLVDRLAVEAAKATR